jgi:hypothetical protein
MGRLRVGVGGWGGWFSVLVVALCSTLSVTFSKAGSGSWFGVICEVAVGPGCDASLARSLLYSVDCSSSVRLGDVVLCRGGSSLGALLLFPSFLPDYYNITDDINHTV